MIGKGHVYNHKSNKEKMKKRMFDKQSNVFKVTYIKKMSAHYFHDKKSLTNMVNILNVINCV